MLLAIIFYSAFPLFTSQPSAVWFLSHQPSDSTLTKATSHLLSAESNEHIPALILSGLLIRISIPIPPASRTSPLLLPWPPTLLTALPVVVVFYIFISLVVPGLSCGM